MKKLYIISTGAGGSDYLTSEALKALEECEVVVSYRRYAKDLKNLLVNKEVYTSGMTKEIQRCKEAIEFAREGKTTAIISNGDVNVFGMATLIVELVDEMDLWEEIEVVSIPGVTAMFAAASKCGAPISQDFAIISLSDKLTEFETIEKRVKNSLEADMVIGIYNPLSKKRIEPYKMFLRHLSLYPDRLVAIASHIGRGEKERIKILTAKELVDKGYQNEDISMSTLIIVGNSTTRFTKKGTLLTPRGYLKKYDLNGEIRANHASS